MMQRFVIILILSLSTRCWAVSQSSNLRAGKHPNYAATASHERRELRMSTWDTTLNKLSWGKHCSKKRKRRGYCKDKDSNNNNYGTNSSSGSYNSGSSSSNSGSYYSGSVSSTSGSSSSAYVSSSQNAYNADQGSGRKWFLIGAATLVVGVIGAALLVAFVKSRRRSSAGQGREQALIINDLVETFKMATEFDRNGEHKKALSMYREGLSRSGDLSGIKNKDNKQRVQGLLHTYEQRAGVLQRKIIQPKNRKSGLSVV